MGIVFFSIAMVAVLTIFFLRRKIVSYLLNEFDIYIKSEVLVYITSILFIFLILLGMLGDNTKEKYSDISKNYNNLKGNDNNQPHRWFDINFDIFK